MLLVIQKDKLRCIEVDENLLVSSFADSWLFQRVYYAISYSSYICCRLITIGKIKFIFANAESTVFSILFLVYVAFHSFSKVFIFKLRFAHKFGHNLFLGRLCSSIDKKSSLSKVPCFNQLKLETKSTRIEILIK